MKVVLQAALSDDSIDVAQPNSQRQLAVSISALQDKPGRTAPLNLCLILDHSGSMQGRPLDMVKQAAHRVVDGLSPGDRLSVVGFDHRAKVLVPNQMIDSPAGVKAQINTLKPSGGTSIDEGMRLAVEELAKGKKESISQAFLLTDGENEHGDNERCLKLAQLAAGYNMTLNSLGFGDNWNQDILEKIADAGGGSLTYIQRPEDAVGAFSRLFERVQSVALTNAHLQMRLMSGVRLAELKPLAQVVPDTIELPLVQEANQAIARLGDLMLDVPRVVLVNLYAGQLAEGLQPLVELQVRYDDPGQQLENCLSESVSISANVVQGYRPEHNPQVQQHVLALAKYRQTQIAETKLQSGDRTGAATMLQTAAKTALQMGDQNAATVLQENATRLQSGQELSESDRKKTRIASKTKLQGLD
ncbi:MAG: VWA domain-containing protein [Kaiparowitsia implicata GSE-PSE-MK54-09C]|jgi:Ca-activated chloride channel family protein|nr:VWA domain-containing protein [Kaiparowitsia implicata GSE-PSE-MK54-09C]